MDMIRRPLSRFILLTALVLSAATSLTAAAPSGRIVFFGDSITEQRVYTRFVMNYIALRYQGANCTFRNAGWGGETARMGLYRLDRDVLSLHPDLVTVCFGMNDGQYREFDQAAYDDYVAALRSIVQRLKAANVKVVVLTPGCVDYDRAPGLSPFYNDTLGRFAQGAIDVATAEQVPYYDMHKLMLDVQTRGKQADPNFTMIPDGIHPSSMGAAVMAYGLIKVLGCAEDAPASLTIDVPTKTITPTKCTVSNVTWDENSLTFIRTDDSLPWWLDYWASPILPYIPISDEINNYRFTVTGLKPGNWRLAVGGVQTGTFSSEQLAAGMNLSDKLGAWTRVSIAVDYLAQQQDHVYYIKWRTLGQLFFPAGVETEFAETQNSLERLAESWETVRNAAPAKDHTWYWSLTYVQ